MTKSGTTIAEDNQRLARALAASEAFEQARESIYDNKTPPTWELRIQILLTLVILVGMGRAAWAVFA